MDQSLKNKMCDCITGNIMPIYVVDEDTMTIVYMNEMMEALAGQSLCGKICYEVLGGKDQPCHGCPKTCADGSLVLWEAYRGTKNELYQIRTLFFEHHNKRYRITTLDDVSQVIGLSREVTKYLSLMKGLSEMQNQIMSNPNGVFIIILKFLKKYFNARKVVVSYPYEKRYKLISLERKEGSISEKIVTGQEPEVAEIFHQKPIVVQVMENKYEFRLLLDTDYVHWKEEHSIIFETIKLYLENAVFREEIEWEIQHDKGTRLYSRAHFMHQAQSFYPSISEIGVIYLDIDNLKKVNDWDGHQMGDLLIQKAADVLISCATGQIQAYRMGGDEFVVILCQMSEGDTRNLMREIQTGIERSNITKPYPPLSMSMGYQWSKGPFDIEDMVKTADEKMYIEKKRKKHHTKVEEDGRKT